MRSLNFDVPVIAHRGASQYAPENTLAAFLKAKELGAEWVEFDVMLSADGEAIVMHDDTLDRTTNGTGRVIDHAYSDLQTLDAGSWFNPRFKGEKIPTFREVLLFLKEHDIAANVEIKPYPGYEEETAIKTMALIAEYWPANRMPLLISSFSVPTLRIVKKVAPTAQLGLLVDEWFLGWEEISAELHCAAIDVNQQILNPTLVKIIKSMNRFLLAYTVNDKARAKELISWGVDAVFSDDLLGILEALKK